MTRPPEFNRYGVISCLSAIPNSSPCNTVWHTEKRRSQDSWQQRRDYDTLILSDLHLGADMSRAREALRVLQNINIAG